MKKSTIQDVAKESGVSITTVSRVINKNYPVKESTRIKVQTVIDRLKFRPNLIAKGLIQSSTRTVGVLTPSIENLFFSEVIKGIDTVMKTNGYTTFLCNTEGDPKLEVDMLNNLINRQVDGIIMIDPRFEGVDRGVLNELNQSVPMLFVNGYSQDLKCNYVLNDARAGILDALKYLKDSGCNKISLLRGENSYSYDVKEEVYRDFTTNQNSWNDILHIADGNNVAAVAQSKKVVRVALESIDRPDAIIACNDWMGLGAINAAKSLGLKIPEEIRIIGFDNTIISQISEPKLSTVDQQMTKLGEIAGKRIYELMKCSDNENQKIYLETELIIRES